MHPAILICIILAVVITIFSIIIAIIEKDKRAFFFIFFAINVLFVGGFGFGIICAGIEWTSEYIKISPDKVETYVFENGGIVASVYEGILYKSTDIKDLVAVKNIDYYTLVINYNAYHYVMSKKLYPVAKGKINDYIKEK